MTKEQTIQIKGIAILMMVFYHLFNRIEFVSLYEDSILPSGNTLSFVLTNCLNPVNYYLILSGYGMYYVWSHTDKRKWKRILSLLFHFWLIAALFICIGAFLYPSKYPGNLKDLLFFFTAIDTHINAEYWFILPFVMVSISSGSLFYFFHRYSVLGGASLIILLVFLQFVFSRFCFDYISASRVVILFFNFFRFIPSFLLGALFCREKWNFANLCTPRYAVLLIFVFLFLRCQIPQSFTLDIFFDFIMIVLLSVIDYGRLIGLFLCFLGKHSMNIWLIHTWFCYYLFKDWIYSFRFPLVIFLILLLCSILVSLLIEQTFSFFSLLGKTIKRCRG